MAMALKLAAIVVPLLFFGTVSAANAIATSTSDCSCGYSVNSTLLTEILETDFLHLYSSSLRGNPCWAPQDYNVTAGAGRGQYGKSATLANVVINPLPAFNAWSGNGVHGGPAGLQLWVDSELTALQQLTMGEIASQRNDILYGSFRVGMRVTSIPGTCTGFFWYRNNSEEIDMEFLSAGYNSSANPVYLVMQTPASANAGFNAQGTSTYSVADLPFVPYEAFHEYRFDWTQTGTSFFADGQWIGDLVYTYPPNPGKLILNHWSNGNPLWSGGPPSQNAVLTIEYVKAYFNSSDPAVQARFQQRCASNTSSSSNTCSVSNSAQFGEQGWFNRGMCNEQVSAAAAATSPATSSASSAGATSSKSGGSQTGGVIPAASITVGIACVLSAFSAFHSSFRGSGSSKRGEL